MQALRMVLSAFVGIRRKGGQDEPQVSPAQIIVIAVIAAACFVGGLIMVVRLVTS